MEGRSAGYLVGKHWTGPKGILEYSRVLASRQSTKLAWTRWAHTAVRALGYQAAIAAALATGGYYAVKYIKKKMMLSKRTRLYKPLKRKRQNDGDVQPRRLFNDTNQGYQQITNVRDRCGKKVNKTSKKLKLIGASMQNTIERFQRCSLTAKLGAYRLSYDKAAGTATTAGFPVYCFELTGVTNLSTMSGGVAAQKLLTPCPGLRLCQAGSTNATIPNYFFWGNDVTLSTAVPVYGRDADDAGDWGHWQTERSSRAQVSSVDPGNGNYMLPWGDKAMIEWVQASFLLYGAKSRPSSCTIEIVQFLDETYVPKVIARNHTDANYTIVDDDPTTVGIVGTSTGEIDKWNAFYTANTDNLVGNPIAKRGLSEYSWDKHTKSLYRRTFAFQPTVTTEGDSTGHQIKVNLKINVNKVCDYVEGPDFGGLVAEDLINANEWDIQGVGKAAPYCAKKGRVFLFVTATNIENSTAASNGETYPSFDLVLRRKMSRIQF